MKDTAERLLRLWRESHVLCIEGAQPGRCNKCRMTDAYLSSSESKESAAGQGWTCIFRDGCKQMGFCAREQRCCGRDAFPALMPEEPRKFRLTKEQICQIADRAADGIATEEEAFALRDVALFAMGELK